MKSFPAFLALTLAAFLMVGPINAYGTYMKVNGPAGASSSSDYVKPFMRIGNYWLFKVPVTGNTMPVFRISSAQDGKGKTRRSAPSTNRYTSGPGSAIFNGVTPPGAYAYSTPYGNGQQQQQSQYGAQNGKGQQPSGYGASKGQQQSQYSKGQQPSGYGASKGQQQSQYNQGQQQPSGYGASKGQQQSQYSKGQQPSGYGASKGQQQSQYNKGQQPSGYEASKGQQQSQYAKGQAQQPGASDYAGQQQQDMYPGMQNGGVSVPPSPQDSELIKGVEVPQGNYQEELYNLEADGPGDQSRGSRRSRDVPSGKQTPFLDYEGSYGTSRPLHTLISEFGKASARK